MENTDNKKYYVKLPIWKKCAFGSIDTANNFSWSFISSFLAIYLTDTFLIPAAFVSIMFFACRFWDAINDPIVGYLADRTRTRWGRYRPWIFFGSAPLFIATALLFWPHMTWSMGAKITIDSATMMNKGLELIEARWLFDLPPENIDIVIHRESVVHSLIEYDDHSVLAQLGVPDMRIPIQYAITWPERVSSPVKQLDLTEWGKLTFYPPDYETFFCMNACRTAISRGGLYPAAVNAANEQAVALFREDKIRFLDIGRLVGAALERPLPTATNMTGGTAMALDDIFSVDRETRLLTEEAARRLK